MMPYSHMRQGSTPSWWWLRITQETQDNRTQKEGKKYIHQWKLKGRGRLCSSSSLIWTLLLLSYKPATTTKNEKLTVKRNLEKPKTYKIESKCEVNKDDRNRSILYR